MEARQDELTTRMAAYFLAARRLRDGARQHPHASGGLLRQARTFELRIALLSREICRTEAARNTAPAPGHASLLTAGAR